MTKAVLLVLLLTVAGLVGWLQWSPRQTARELQRAAVASDTTAITRLVNFAELRQQLVADAEAYRTRLGGKQPDFATMTPLVGGLVMPSNELAVSSLSSPGGFTQFLNSVYWAPEGQPKPLPLSMGYDEFPTRFAIELLIPMQPHPDTGRLVLRRHGLAWQVEQLRIVGVCEAPCQ